jgi:photosystem II stability/assembly factor-like uncharacterized protein
MSLLSSPDITEGPAPQSALPGKKHRRRWPIFLVLITLVIVIAIVWQVFYQQQTGMIVGRPLASRQTHLHAVVLGGQPGVMYLGTHFGLFTSTDGGRTWPQQQGELNSAMITSVAVSPTNPALLAVLAVPRVSGQLQAGIYISSDTGKNWRFTLPKNLLPNAYPYTIQAAPGANGHFFAFFSSAGWFETHDLGQHWSPLTPSSFANMQNPSLLTDAHNPAHLLIGGDQGLFESENDGQSWQQITAFSGSVLALIATQPTQNGSRTILCATEQGLYRGLQQRNSIVWHAVPTPVAAPATRLIISPDGSNLYALFGSDLWFSGDQGTNWVHRWHFTRGDMIALVINPNNPRQLFAGFFWPGLVLSSTNGGTSWQTLTD